MIWLILGIIVYTLWILAYIIFTIYNLIAKDWKAFTRSFITVIVLLVLGAVFLFVIPDYQVAFFAATLIVSVCFCLWLLISPRPRDDIKQTGIPAKTDERDVIFARFDLEESSPQFQEYYSRKPEYKQIDDNIRKLPDILTPFHIKKDPIFFTLAAGEFDVLEQQLLMVSGPVSPMEWEYSPEENTRIVKKLIHYLGGIEIGICELDPAYVYSHVGRGPEPYGQEIKTSQKYAVVFTLEMNYEMIAAAPLAPVLAETAKQYIEGAKISLLSASFIRRMGFPARAHIAGSNYQVMLTPLGYLAGLGELGRLGVLITEKHGPRIRLGCVTTDMPLMPDKPKIFGVQNYCQICKKCAINCPGQAIPAGDKTIENGVEKWVINREECYRFWRKSGSDCSRCIYVCPYSNPDNFFHNTVRKVVTGSSAAQYIAARCDDIFFGLDPRPHKPWNVPSK